MDISRFYEVAVVQVEGYHKFVHKEAEAAASISATRTCSLTWPRSTTTFSAGLKSLSWPSATRIGYIPLHSQYIMIFMSQITYPYCQDSMERSETKWRLRHAMELKEREVGVSEDKK
ncbi:hypothetical protein CDL15_Pgr006333 [Punica granatum]|uniref:Uncharacterized protein n=1 Tax=Punica granatum TaxID=22663 RepID=A0A218WAJ4_PUNGR|nr:hypothetical protein CDL15_Pgr006333 [Punica granatum]